MYVCEVYPVLGKCMQAIVLVRIPCFCLKNLGGLKKKCHFTKDLLRRISDPHQVFVGIPPADRSVDPDLSR